MHCGSFDIPSMFVLAVGCAASTMFDSLCHSTWPDNSIGIVGQFVDFLSMCEVCSCYHKTLAWETRHDWRLTGGREQGPLCLTGGGEHGPLCPNGHAMRPPAWVLGDQTTPFITQIYAIMPSPLIPILPHFPFDFSSLYWHHQNWFRTHLRLTNCISGKLTMLHTRLVSREARTYTAPILPFKSNYRWRLVFHWVKHVNFLCGHPLIWLAGLKRCHLTLFMSTVLHNEQKNTDQ